MTDGEHSRAGAMGSRERSVRSRIKQIVAGRPLIRGSLTLRQGTCGKENCRCRRGEKHPHLVLSASQDGRYRQKHIPADQHEQVKEWVENYQTLRELLEELSRMQWERIAGRSSKGTGSPAPKAKSKARKKAKTKTKATKTKTKKTKRKASGVEKHNQEG